MGPMRRLAVDDSAVGLFKLDHGCVWDRHSSWVGARERMRGVNGYRLDQAVRGEQRKNVLMLLEQPRAEVVNNERGSRRVGCVRCVKALAGDQRATEKERVRGSHGRRCSGCGCVGGGAILTRLAIHLQRLGVRLVGAPVEKTRGALNNCPGDVELVASGKCLVRMQSSWIGENTLDSHFVRCAHGVLRLCVRRKNYKTTATTIVVKDG